MDLEKRVQQYQEVLEKDRKTLIIFGGIGVGKTYLVKNHTPAHYFIDEPTFKQHVTAGNMRLAPPEVYGSGRDAYPLECLSRKPLVVYDDLGCSGHTDAYIEKMLYRINRRYEKRLKTIVTTNLTPQEFQKDYELRLASRFLEDSISIIITGTDLRKKNALHFSI